MLPRRALLVGGSALLAAPALVLPHWMRSAAAQRGASSVLPSPITTPSVVVMGKQIDDVEAGFDPAEAHDATSTEVNGNCYRKLVTQDPRDPDKIVGDLAERWTVSSDGLTFVFHLRPGSVFESAKPLTAADVAFSFQRVVRLNKAPAFIFTQFGFTPTNVDRLVRATGPNTAEIKLPEARAGSFLLNCLAANIGGVVERATALANQSNGDLGNAWLRQRSAGSGPYRLLEWTQGEQVVIEANSFSPIKPKTTRIILRHIGEPGVQLTELQKGEVDIARDLGPEQQQVIAGKPDYMQVLTHQLTSVYAAMNMAMPQFAKLEVRQAVKWAIDYDGITRRNTLGTYKVWQSFLPDGMPGAISDQPYQRDVARARELMAKAGYRGGFSVTLDHVANPVDRQIAQAVQESLGNIGIQARLLASSKRDVVAKTRARQHQIAVLTWHSDYLDPHANTLAFCANPDDADYAQLRMLAWRNHYVNDDLTAMVDQAAREMDGRKRAEAYAQMQRIFMDQSPFVMLLQRAEIAALRKGVSGLVLGTLPDYTRYAQMTKA